MPITINDIKLLKSQAMNDTDFGGGGPSGNAIEDAVSNSIFPDITEVDRARGKVRIRKVFVSIQTDTTDVYGGGNIIVANPPADPNVSVTLFSTNDMFDRREGAAARVSSYLNGQGEINGFLYENHIAGQRAIQIMQRLTTSLPTTGHVFLLRKREGFSDMVEQYVRVTRVQSEERTFTYNGDTDYKALIVTCDISDALLEDYPGTAANRSFQRDSTKTIIRDTVVADATTYHGVVKLTEPITLGDTTLTAESIYTQLVPSSRTETSQVGQRPAAAFEITLAAAPRLVTAGGSPLSQRIKIGQENRGFNFVTILTPLPAPGSVQIVFRAFKQNYKLTDDGAGNLTGSGSGTVNYLTGDVSVTLAAYPDDRSSIMFYWGPNTAYTSRAGTPGFRMPEYSWTLENQGVVPNSVDFTWESGGVTKTASDNGTGKITGDATGEIMYSTGMVRLRPTAMPDAGGQIAVDYTYRTLVEEALTGLSPDGTGTVAITFASEPVPGTVQAQWLTTRETSTSSGATSTSGSTNKSSMTNSSSGNSTKTGPVMMDVAQIFETSPFSVLKPYNAPGSESPADGSVQHLFNTTSGIETVRQPVMVTTSESTSGTGSESTSTGATYTTASTQTSKSAITVQHLITDNGSGSWFGTFGTISYVAKTASLKVRNDYSETSYSSNYEDAKEFETLNATGEATTTTGGGASTSVSSGGGGSSTAKGGSYGTTTQTEVYGASSLVVRYQVGSAGPTAHSETYTPPGVSIDLCPYTTECVVPGSVRFTWMGTVYEDFEGIIYRGRTDTDPGIASGKLIYTSGLANMSDYVVSGSATSLTVQSLWTRKQREHIANFTFSTPLAPIKPTGLVLSVEDVEGNQLLGTADIDGNVTGTHIHGKIDYESGLVEVQTGDYVLDSSLTAKQKLEWWYDANDVRVADGKIWRPWPIDPETVRYNAVAYFYLPQDAELLGLDPVRLPQDGRVPIFRSGGLIVISNSQTLSPRTVANTDTIDFGRERLSRVRLIGNDGTVITTGYTVDLESGIATVTDIAGWSQPITPEHRIEDMVQVAQFQISGQISVTKAISHSYPADTSYVSSALEFNDMVTFSEPMFDQVSWNNTWSDSPIGSAATGTYNEGAYPVVLTNKGTITERWAFVVRAGATSYDIIGEHMGVIGQGTFTAECAPLNPWTGVPLFRIAAAGWGSGWSAGNVLRMNTVGTIAPVWVAETVQQSEPTEEQHQFTLLVRGGVDRP